jgi:hypothetical protein
VALGNKFVDHRGLLVAIYVVSRGIEVLAKDVKR